MRLEAQRQKPSPQDNDDCAAASPVYICNLFSFLYGNLQASGLSFADACIAINEATKWLSILRRCGTLYLFSAA
jgi:hypothetical protein